jgi:hypothetical protein
MIKHSIKDDIIFVSITNTDFSYRIPVKKIDNVIDWKVGEKGTESIVIKNVSTWTLQLFTKKITENKLIKQFKNIVQESSPENSINWEDTMLAVNIQNQYNWLVETNKTAKKKNSNPEIISILKKKFNLD